MSKLLVVSELYYPEETSTGYFVTGIAEGIAKSSEWEVSVLSAQPTYSQRGTVAPAREQLKGVSVERLAAPLGNKNNLLGRLWNFTSLTIRMGWSLLFRIKRGQIVLVVTNPPSLPLLVGWLACLKGARPVLLVHDVYPDVLVPTGFLKAGSLFWRVLNGVQKHMLRRMSHVIVLGRDMEKRLRDKCSDLEGKLSIIPNWGDVERIKPEPGESNRVRAESNLTDKFIVQFSGNLGRTHGLEDLVEIAERFKDHPKVRFLVFGWGSGRKWLENQLEQRGLDKVVLLPPCKAEELSEHLNACDLFMLPFKSGMEGISVPSRMYNVMAAGNAILAVASPQSELAQVIEEENIGYVVEPNDHEAMERFILRAVERQEDLEAMGKSSRNAAVEKYNREVVVQAYIELLDSIAGM